MAARLSNSRVARSRTHPGMDLPADRPPAQLPRDASLTTRSCTRPAGALSARGEDWAARSRPDAGGAGRRRGLTGDLMCQDDRAASSPIAGDAVYSVARLPRIAPLADGSRGDVLRVHVLIGPHAAASSLFGCSHGQASITVKPTSLPGSGHLLHRHSGRIHADDRIIRAMQHQHHALESDRCVLRRLPSPILAQAGSAPNPVSGPRVEHRAEQCSETRRLRTWLDVSPNAQSAIRLPSHQSRRESSTVPPIAPHERRYVAKAFKIRD